MAMFAVMVASPLVFPIASSLAAEPRAAEPAGWKLTWSDEFDGDKIDLAKWDFDLGNGFFNYDANQWISGWGNAELQSYTDHPANVSVKEGLLRIRALKQSYQGSGYTSARIKSRSRDGSALFAQTYGRFEFRAKFPAGQGLWSALWLLPAEEKYGGWAASGEIDVVEIKGQEPSKISGSLHFGDRWPGNQSVTENYDLPNGGLATDFHVYRVEWTATEIRWYVDDVLFQTRSKWSTNGPAAGGGKDPKAPFPAPFDQPFFILMNLAVGGNFLGNPDATTDFPAEMQVDYVRVYERR